jgi:hypothetical protein
MAANAGFEGAKSARDSFGRLYDKILAGSENNTSAEGETAEPTPRRKKKGTPGKRKAGMWEFAKEFLVARTVADLTRC